jgi:hypothetical protein
MKKAEHTCWDIEIEILTTISKEIQKILKKMESLLHSRLCLYMIILPKIWMSSI